MKTLMYLLVLLLAVSFAAAIVNPCYNDPFVFPPFYCQEDSNCGVIDCDGQLHYGKCNIVPGAPYGECTDMPPPKDVPEFTAIGAGIAALGAGAVYFIRKRK
jgi:hypothetical protein